MTERQEIAHVLGLIAKIQTLATGGFRIWVDGTTQDIAQAAFLMPFADTPGALVEVFFYPADKQGVTIGKGRKLEARTKRKSEWTTAEQ